MPLPKPRDNESEDDFISRCMSDDLIQEEYDDNDQRLAVCYSQWRNKGGIMDLERKSVELKLNDDKEGSFTARIATLNVIDKDGDITRQGAFPQGKEVLVSAYQHGSWMGALPVGKAVINESGDDVIAEGEFNLNTQIGKEHYEAVKFSGGLQEWSYGFRVEESGDETIDDQQVRVIKKVDPYEISPVLLGAGVDTATLAIKSEKSTYADQAETVLAAVKDLVTRTKSLADLRREEGRDLSEKNRERIEVLHSSLTTVAEGLKELLEATEPVDDNAIAQATLLLTKIKQELLEEN